MRRVGLFTGTFDPVHSGHIELARAATLQSRLDEVWLLVNPQPSNKPAVVPWRHRIEMARRAVAEVPSLVVYTGEGAEATHEMANFKRIMSAHPEARFVFILGMDAFLQLDRWTDLESVVNDTTYVVADRSGSSQAAVSDLRRRLGELGSALKVSVFDFDGHGMTSSSAVRRMVRAGDQSDWLHAGVREYIAAHYLYR